MDPIAFASVLPGDLRRSLLDSASGVGKNYHRGINFLKSKKV